MADYGVTSESIIVTDLLYPDASVTYLSDRSMLAIRTPPLLATRRTWISSVAVPCDPISDPRRKRFENRIGQDLLYARC